MDAVAESEVAAMTKCELIINKSNIPVFRSGVGLLILPLTILLSTFLYIALETAFEYSFVGLLSSILAGAAGLLYFRATASKVTRVDNEITIVRSFDAITLPTGSLKKTNVFVFPPSHWVVAVLHVDGGGLPIFFHFVVVDTSNVGDFRDTVKALRMMLDSSASHVQ